MHNLINFLSFTLNWLPILHVSCDSKFGSFGQGCSNIRISLITLPFGVNKYYFISFNKDVSGVKFTIYKKLNFYDIVPISSKSEIEEKVSIYKKLISHNKDEKHSIHIELLKEKISQFRNSINASYTKLNSYRAIVLTFAGVGIFLLSEFAVIKNHMQPFIILIWLLLILLTLYVLNSFMFVKLALTMKAFAKSKFSDLKNNTTKSQLAESFYTDFISLQNQSNVITSITKNTEKYFNRSFVILGITWMLLFGYQHNIINVEPNKKPKFENKEYLVVEENKTLNNQQLAKFLDDINGTQGTIYIISRKGNNSSTLISHFLKFYFDTKYKIEIIDIKNDVINKESVLLRYEGQI